MPKKYLNIYDKILKNSEWKDKCLVSTYKVKRDSKCPQVTHNGKCITISRVSWEWHKGEIPKGLLVCHHCDNPKCFRIEHLFLGTPSDNMQDMVKKKRDNIFGARKYSQKQITKAIELRKIGFTYVEIAKKLKMRIAGVSALLIRAKIKRGPMVTKKPRIMTEEIKKKILFKLQDKTPHVDIYRSLNISESSLYLFLKTLKERSCQNKP